MTTQRMSLRLSLAVLLSALTGCGGKAPPEAAFAAGLAHAEEGAWQAAVDDYDRALQAKPDWLDAYVNRGAAKAALEDYAGAIADYDAALQIDPKDADALVNRGVVQHELGKHAEALEDYTAALAVDGSNIDAYRNRAITFAAAGELVAAVEDYSSAIWIDPSDVTLYRERAEVRRQQEDEDGEAVDDILADLTESVAAAPDDPAPRRERGLVFFDVGEYALALVDLSEAISLAPADADTYVARAHAWFIQGHSDKAIEDYTQAIDRGVEPAWEAHAGRGNAYESLGDIAHAMSDYSESVRLNPEDYDASIRLAWILATHPVSQYRNGKRAVELATQAVELTEGRHWRALDVMAAACAEIGDFDNASSYAQRAVDLAPDDLRGVVRKRLTMYRSNQAFRDVGD